MVVNILHNLYLNKLFASIICSLGSTAMQGRLKDYTVLYGKIIPDVWQYVWDFGFFRLDFKGYVEDVFENSSLNTISKL